MNVAEEIPYAEAMACVKVLVALLKADGAIDPNEQKSLQAAILALKLSEDVSLESLLAEDVDLDAELGKISSAAGRSQTYRSAGFMVHADGHGQEQELAMLERIAARTQPTDDERARIARLWQTEPKGRVATLVDAIAGMFRRSV